jgi:hypothetical protein
LKWFPRIKINMMRPHTSLQWKLVRRRDGRLKGGCSQDWLPHKGRRINNPPQVTNLPRKKSFPGKGD